MNFLAATAVEPGMQRYSAFAFAAVLIGFPASAAVTVSYEDPVHFSDAEDRSTTSEDAAFGLAAHLELVGNRLIDQAAELRIHIVDIDRAGRPRLNFPGELRVMTGRADFPCVELTFTLSAPRRKATSGRERVCDVNYLQRPLPASLSSDPLAYEKRMLSGWLRTRFGSRDLH